MLRRAFIVAMIFSHSAVQAAENKSKRALMRADLYKWLLQGGAYVLEDGDGAPETMGRQHILTVARENWFNGTLSGEAANLFTSDPSNGKECRQYIALTSRQTASIEDQFVSNGLASVVVHLIRNPSADFSGRLNIDYSSVGMTILRER